MKFSFSSQLRCGWAQLDFTLAPTPITLRVNESPRAEPQLWICWGAPWSQGIFSESTSKQLAQKKGKLVAEQGNNVCSDNKWGFVKECRLKLRAFSFNSLMELKPNYFRKVWDEILWRSPVTSRSPVNILHNYRIKFKVKEFLKIKSTSGTNDWLWKWRKHWGNIFFWLWWCYLLLLLFVSVFG